MSKMNGALALLCMFLIGMLFSFILQLLVMMLLVTVIIVLSSVFVMML